MPQPNEFMLKKEEAEDTYQRKLTAGTNITIDPVTNTISSTGGNTVSSTEAYQYGDILNTLTIDGVNHYVKTPSLIAGPNVNITRNQETGALTISATGGGSSNVIPNPEGVPADVLETIGIGNIIYRIASIVELTEDEYENLPSSKNTDDVMYLLLENEDIFNGGSTISLVDAVGITTEETSVNSGKGFVDAYEHSDGYEGFNIALQNLTVGNTYKLEFDFQFTDAQFIGTTDYRCAYLISQSAKTDYSNYTSWTENLARDLLNHHHSVSFTATATTMHISFNLSGCSDNTDNYFIIDNMMCLDVAKTYKIMYNGNQYGGGSNTNITSGTTNPSEGEENDVYYKYSYTTERLEDEITLPTFESDVSTHINITDFNKYLNVKFMYHDIYSSMNTKILSIADLPETNNPTVNNVFDWNYAYYIACSKDSTGLWIKEDGDLLKKIYCQYDLYDYTVIDEYVKLNDTWVKIDTGGGGASTISDLTDVNLTDLSDGQILKYNSTSQKWENANESGGSSDKVTEVYDVIASGDDCYIVVDQHIWLDDGGGSITRSTAAYEDITSVNGFIARLTQTAMDDGGSSYNTDVTFSFDDVNKTVTMSWTTLSGSSGCYVDIVYTKVSPTIIANDLVVTGTNSVTYNIAEIVQGYQNLVSSNFMFNLKHIYSDSRGLGTSSPFNINFNQATGILTVSWNNIGSYNELTGDVLLLYRPNGYRKILDMIGATDELNGYHGYTPAPLIGDENKFLKGDGTWAYPQSGTEVEANPIGTPTDTLNTISIDGTIYEIEGGGRSGSAKIDLLYDSGDYNTPAEKGVDIDLAHNLSDYDEGYIVYSYPSDRTDPTLYNTSYQSFLVDDVLGYPAGKKCVLIAGYGTRHRFIDFTDTTFNIRTSGSDFEVYKIYGVKYGSGCGQTNVVTLFDTPTTTQAWANPVDVTFNTDDYDLVTVDVSSWDGSDEYHNLITFELASCDVDDTKAFRVMFMNNEGAYLTKLSNGLRMRTTTGKKLTYNKVIGYKFGGGGSEVEANPTDPATDTLETISIDGTVYDISGSGGETVYDVNDYYLQDGQISDGGNRQFLTAYYDKPLISGKNYLINFKNSVDGSIVGMSLFKYTSDFTTTMSGGGSIGTITMIITSTSITSSNYTGSWQNIYVDVYREISSADFYHPVIYSTEEREIGVWTDNKPLYQKTITFTNVSGAKNSLDLNIANVDYIGLVIEGSSANNRPLPYVTGTDYTNNIGGFFDVQTNTTTFEWRAGSGSTSSTDIVLTVQYTKTTDVAGSGSYNTLGVPNVPIYTLSERVLGLNNYTLNLTHSDGTVITQTITSDDQIVNFEITKPGIWTLSNTKDSYTKTYTINTTSDIFAGSIVSIIPILSNNTGSNGVAIAPSSSPNYGDGNAWWAFDNSFSTELEYLGEGQRNAYIGYIFNNDVYIDNLKAWMGNYSGSNDFSIQLQITLDGSTWTTVNTFKVAGYSDGTYGEFDYDLKQMVRGFRYYSSTLKNGGQNWKTYEIQAWGVEL